MKIILASASPRRKELLEKAGVEIEVAPSAFEEYADASLPPDKYTLALATQKAENVAKTREGIILGADTVVVLDGNIIGKPADAADASATLKRLSGRKHEVYTSVCMIYGASHMSRKQFTVVSKVHFNQLTYEQIDEYVATGKPLDKAGSYGVQDGYGLVNKVEGSLTNVIGLPVDEVLLAIKEIQNGKTENSD